MSSGKAVLTNVIGDSAYLKCEKDGCPCKGYSKFEGEANNLLCQMCGHAPLKHRRVEKEEGAKRGAVAEEEEHHHHSSSSHHHDDQPPASLPDSYSNYWWTLYYQQISQVQMYNMWASWLMLDRDRNGHIFAQELALMTVPAGPTLWAGRMIGLPAAMRLIQLFDTTNTRTITFYEFAALHQFFTQMQNAFHSCDYNRSGALEAHEVLNALHVGGIQVSLPVIQAYFAKFGLLGWYGQTLDFMGFMMMCCDITLAKNRFSLMDTDQDGRISLDEMLVISADLTAKASLLGGVY